MVHVAAHNLTTPLADTSAENFMALLAGKSAVCEHKDLSGSNCLVWASLFPKEQHTSQHFTRFENLLISSIRQAQQTSGINLASDRTIFIISTTKGNIELLEQNPDDKAIASKINLHDSARKVAQAFGNQVKPMVISNACISGVAALLYAKRLLQTGQFDTAVVAGADTVGKFVMSGFGAFQALSASRCKPFSADRDGINLGEAAATIILSTTKPASSKSLVALAGGAITNDANHISGPSRTGAELALAIEKAMSAANVAASDIGFISAHGTATPYNDEMEARAFTLTGLNNKPLFSIKSALGHTLGAAGLVESVLSVLSLQHGQVLPTTGYSHPMEGYNLNVSNSATEIGARAALKTASGFGGCNGALLFVSAN